jgi:hypothetical protein
MAKKMTTFKGIQIPRDLKISECSEKSIRINIFKPEKNMQTDAAAFESWALIFHAAHKLKVEMDFRIFEPITNLSTLEAYKNPKLQHYLRFLFRAWKFADQMEWFSIGDKACRLSIQNYVNLFFNSDMTNNIPLRRAKIKENIKSLDEEHILENIFVYSAKAKPLIDIVSDSSKFEIPQTLYNQLPNGLFTKNQVSKTNKSFPTGYFDLWGINRNNELCIFELKNHVNQKAGIISELYFYANYANEVFLTDRFNKGNSTHRGYDVLKKAVERGVTKIQACFLAPQFHSEISKRKSDIQKFLNNGTGKIAYHFLTFDQEAITNLSGCLPTK